MGIKGCTAGKALWVASGLYGGYVSDNIIGTRICMRLPLNQMSQIKQKRKICTTTLNITNKKNQNHKKVHKHTIMDNDTTKEKKKTDEWNEDDDIHSIDLDDRNDTEASIATTYEYSSSHSSHNSHTSHKHHTHTCHHNNHNHRQLHMGGDTFYRQETARLRKLGANSNSNSNGVVSGTSNIGVTTGNNDQ